MTQGAARNLLPPLPMPTDNAAMEAEPPKRRWYQFSLRTLLIVVTVIAVLFGLLRLANKVIDDGHNAWLRANGLKDYRELKK